MKPANASRQLMHEVNGVKIYRETRFPGIMTRSMGEVAMVVHVVVSHGGVEHYFAVKDLPSMQRLEKLLLKTLAGFKTAEKINKWLSELPDDWGE